jgi:hypothetical protein
MSIRGRMGKPDRGEMERVKGERGISNQWTVNGERGAIAAAARSAAHRLAPSLNGPGSGAVQMAFFPTPEGDLIYLALVDF